MSDTKKTSRPAVKKTEPAKAPAKPADIVTLREAAANLKVEPRHLRVILRSTGMRAKGRYEWKRGDAFLSKLPTIIREYKAAQS